MARAAKEAILRLGDRRIAAMPAIRAPLGRTRANRGLRNPRAPHAHTITQANPKSANGNRASRTCGAALRGVRSEKMPLVASRPNAAQGSAARSAIAAPTPVVAHGAIIPTNAPSESDAAA